MENKENLPQSENLIPFDEKNPELKLFFAPIFPVVEFETIEDCKEVLGPLGYVDGVMWDDLTELQISIRSLLEANHEKYFKQKKKVISEGNKEYEVDTLEWEVKEEFEEDVNYLLSIYWAAARAQNIRG